MSGLQPIAAAGQPAMQQLTTPPPATKSEALLNRFRALRERQATLYSDPYVRVLLLALKGAGKTTFLSTAVQPIVIDSFDPGGTLSIKQAVERSNGQIIVDTRYENEDLRQPHAFREWEEEFDAREREGFFNHIGTYCIDSGYLWMESLLAKQRIDFGLRPLNDLVPEGAVKGKDLRNLYGNFLEANLYWTRRLLNLPCHVIFTCHLDVYVDQVAGRTETTILAPGNASKERIPVPFPEMWVLVEDDNKQRQLITGKHSRYTGSTRIGGNGKLATVEAANFCSVLQKCGYNTQNKGEI